MKTDLVEVVNFSERFLLRLELLVGLRPLFFAGLGFQIRLKLVSCEAATNELEGLRGNLLQRRREQTEVTGVFC